MLAKAKAKAAEVEKAAKEAAAEVEKAAKEAAAAADAKYALPPAAAEGTQLTAVAPPSAPSTRRVPHTRA
jgi:hypothetical protein